VFHNRASDMTAFCEILRGSKQWWTLASKISRGSGPSNPRRIDAYDWNDLFSTQNAPKCALSKAESFLFFSHVSLMRQASMTVPPIDRRCIYRRAPSCPEIPEISQLSWNCPEISNCAEILLIWSECPDNKGWYGPLLCCRYTFFTSHDYVYVADVECQVMFSCDIVLFYV